MKSNPRAQFSAAWLARYSILFAWLLAVLVSPLLVSPAASALRDMPSFTVASAANFASTLEKLLARYRLETGCSARVVVGSTGQLVARILSGAPYDVFLSADTKRIQALRDANLVGDEQIAAYAVGRLAYYDREGNMLDKLPSPHAAARNIIRLRGVPLALPNPQTAPYGEVAAQFLRSVEARVEGGVSQSEQTSAPPSADTKRRLIFGANVLHTFALIQRGDVRHGFVAYSTLLDNDISPIKYRLVWSPLDVAGAAAQATLTQSAALLSTNRTDNSALVAQDFFLFLTSPAARQIITSAGYGLPAVAAGTRGGRHERSHDGAAQQAPAPDKTSHHEKRAATSNLASGGTHWTPKPYC